MGIDMGERRAQLEKIEKICKIVGGVGLVGLLGGITTGLITNNYKYDLASYVVSTYSLMTTLFSAAIYGQASQEKIRLGE
mgnify:CR=1 FL=1